MSAPASGRVILVGAGPGAPDLITVRGERALRSADVVVYDALAPASLLSLAPPHAERIDVGRRGHTEPPRTQEDISALLVRLKGGDPFVFGRGGEEALALANAGIACEVVPGITAATGVAAAVGIPLTHRTLAQACVLVTGSRRKGAPDLDWKGLARPGQTIVVYMGLAGLERVARELVAHGLSPRTPAAIIQQGTMRGQRVVEGTLASLPRLAEAAQLRAPTLIVIGKVVRLRRALAQAAAC